MLPNNVLQDINFSIDGVLKTGQASGLKPPKLNFKTDDFMNGGSIAEVEVAFMTLEKLEASFTTTDLSSEDLILAVGRHDQDIPFHFYASVRKTDGSIYGVKYLMRGFPKPDQEDWKTGEKVEREVNLSLHYCRYEDPNNQIEIDIGNSRLVINGQDKFADTARALNIR